MGRRRGRWAQVAAAKQAAYLSKRGEMEARSAAIHGKTLQAVGVMRRRAERDATLQPGGNELSARGDSQRAIEEEGEELIAVWTEDFTSSFVPAPGLTLAVFSALFNGAAGPPVVSSLRALKTEYKAAPASARKAVGLYNALLNELWDDCVDWYGEATAVFPEGTNEGDLIRSEVPTIYNPGTGGGTTEPPPTPPATPMGTTYTQDAPGEGVTANAVAVAGVIARIYQRAAGDSGDPVLVATASMLPTTFSASPGEYEYTMTYGNGVGESAPTAPVILTVA